MTIFIPLLETVNEPKFMQLKIFIKIPSYSIILIEKRLSNCNLYPFLAMRTLHIILKYVMFHIIL